MKKILFYIFIGIGVIGLIMNIGNIFDFIFRTIISIAIFIAILYAIYYFFILSEDERKYRKAMRQTKRKRKFRK
ncbi:MAG TPA: SA1362 family protein [Jeotgalicoccus sp.]|nr:SA1362 family protein [Jeotgalicoccus sp.]